MAGIFLRLLRVVHNFYNYSIGISGFLIVGFFVGVLGVVLACLKLLLEWDTFNAFESMSIEYFGWLHNPYGLFVLLGLMIFALGFIGMVLCDFVVHPLIKKNERTLLIALYDATNGENWENNTNWKTDKPLSEWYGVSTNGSGQVTRLWLSNNDLSGQIPPELGQLQNLTVLGLYNNKLSGQIPVELGQLENLTELWLSDNELSGQIPPELGQLQNLTVLSLNDNELSGQIPPELGQLQNLTVLWLNDNELSGQIPPELGQLQNLTVLSLNDNKLSGQIPVELAQLTKLQWLRLYNNDLSGQIPPELGQLQNLITLRLYNNKLSGQIPPELGQLQNLTVLSLNDNKLSGQIPVELAQLTKLQWLRLYNNDLSGQIPPELGQLQNLITLRLYNNKLSGQIPPELGQLENLRDLGLYNNGLSGQIPVELSKLTSLEELELEGNPGLYAPSDAEFRAWLANLKKFSIDNLDQIDDSDRYEELAAKFEGLMDKLDAVSLVPISDDLDPIDASDRAALIALYDATNGENWGNNTNWKTDKPLGEWYGVSTNDSGQVIELSLYYNGLSGQIPPELGQLQNLTVLGLYNNKLSGQIPAELGQLQNLIGLGLYNNKLSGQIPAELGQLENLEELRLDGNPGLSAPSDPAFQAWLANLKKFSFDGPDLKEIERLLGGVKSPGDQVEVLAFLKLYLGLTQTLKEKIGAIGNGVTTLQGFAIQKALDDLTEIEETIAQVAKQTEGVVQQRSELEGQNAQLGSELEDKNSVLKDKRTGLEAKNSALKDEKATFERRREELKEVERLIAERETAIPQLEKAIQEIDAKSAAFCVDDTVEKFHETVEKLRQKEQGGRDIMGQVGGVLRLHQDDNVEVLEALKQCGELVNLNTAIDLGDRVAKNLSDLDHRLGTLVEERD